MNKIRAKMKVSDVTMNGTTEQVTLYAVSGGSEENKSFAKYTPYASFIISIDNPSAQGVLVKDKEFYLDFTPAN